MDMEINSSYLESKWASIDIHGIGAYRFQRLSADSRLEINIGLNHRGDRCLILELPRDNGMVFFNRERQNLSIFHIPEHNYIVIELRDPFFNDLFTDLIVSLYQRIKDIADVDRCARELIGAFNKWSEFFSAQFNTQLSEQTVKGLWGELFLLREFLIESGPEQTDQVLDCWKGPYDGSHDFIFATKNVEVKTRDEVMIDINISSEFQLEPEFEKQLELAVLNLRADQSEGLSIGQLTEDIRERIRLGFGDIEILLQGLAQKGLHLNNLSSYPQSYLAVSKTVYDCLHPDFPRLHRSALDPALQHVKYTIRTSGLDRFILTQTIY
jgi:hypothetical protein